MRYKITYPNGKIYVGQDMTDTLTYFGSVNSRLVEPDFEQGARGDFFVRKQILWYAKTSSRSELTEREVHFIRQLQSNDPDI